MAINLLPPQAKKNFHLENINRQVIFFGELVFMVAILLAVLMFGEVVFAYTKLQSLNRRLDEAKSRTEVKQITQFQKQLRLFKSDVERANRILEQHPSLGNVIVEFVRELPDVVRITSLDLDMRTRKVVLSGFAPTRGDLLKLKDALRKNPRYADIDFPLAHLLKEANINFTTSFSFQR